MPPDQLRLWPNQLLKGLIFQTILMKIIVLQIQYNGVKVAQIIIMSCLNIEQTQPLAHQLAAICMGMKQQLSLSNYINSKPFFVSSTHHFLEKLIHLHSTPINQLLAAQFKRLSQQILQAKCQEINQQSNCQEIDAGGKQSEMEKLIGGLIMRECFKRSILQIKNIFLQISCLMTYSCGICLKNNESKPQSIKLIKHYSHQLYVQQPKTAKTISLQQPHIDNNSFESVLQSMKGERNKIRQRKEARQRKINSLWNMLSSAVELDREQFTTHYIMEQRNKENNILKALWLKNHKNSCQIGSFSKIAKLYFKKHKRNRIPQQSSSTTNSEFINHKNKSISLKDTLNQTRIDGIGHKHHNSIRIKQQVLPQFNKAMQRIGSKVCFLDLKEPAPVAINKGGREAHSSHFYRSFKSSNNIQPIQIGYKSVNKSYKLI